MSRKPTLDVVIKQEKIRLRELHPTPEDVPGCMKLFDDFLLCHGETPDTVLYCNLLMYNLSHSQSVQVTLQIWPDG